MFRTFSFISFPFSVILPSWCLQTLSYVDAHLCTHIHTQWCKSFNWLVGMSIRALISLWVISQLLCFFVCLCVCMPVCVFTCPAFFNLFVWEKIVFVLWFPIRKTNGPSFCFYLLPSAYLLASSNFSFLIPPPVLCFHFHLFFLSFYVPHSKRPPLSSVISYSLHLILSTSGSMTLISVFIKPLDDFISFSLNATFLVFASGTQAYSAVHKPFTVDVLWTIGLRPGCQHLTWIRVTTPNRWLAITQRWLLSSSDLLFSLSSLYVIYTHHTLD